MSRISKPNIAPDKENALWNNSLFVLDTSALCRFYSLTPAARVRMLQVLDEVPGNLWLPHRVLVEFNRHCDEELKKPLGKYGIPSFIGSNHFESEFDTYIKKLKSSIHQHPYVPEEILDKWEKLHDEYHTLMERIRVSIENTLRTQKEELEEQIKNDEIADYILGIPVGKEILWNDLISIIEEGTVRYSNKIPPGYMDNDEKTSIDRFGDLIIWKEILSESAQKKKNVIFITQDLKEDWSAIKNQDSIVPREELLQEFRQVTGQDIWMYTISDFLQKMAERNGIKMDSEKSLMKLMLELNLAAIPENNIKASCPNCKRIIGISDEDIFWEWDTEIQEDRSMGVELCHYITTSIPCPECGEEHEITISAYEYPIGSINYVDLESLEFDILHTPDIYSFIQDVPINEYEVCNRCGEWKDDVDASGFCAECRSEFKRFMEYD